jgi:DNA polymerase-3 subunit delta'
MDHLSLNPSTKVQLDNYLKTPNHGLMLLGSSGMGKFSLAVAIAEQLLGIEDFLRYPQGRILKTPEDKKLIPVELAREIVTFMSLKVAGNRDIDRVVIIQDAQELSLSAQNALLKTLEEPPKGSVLILTANSEQNLLPTVKSRMQRITVQKPSKSDLRSSFKALSDKDFDKFYAISAGLPGLMSALSAKEDHPLIEATSIARKILVSSTYERLGLVDQLSKDKELVINCLAIMQQMAELGLKNASSAAGQRWSKVLEASYNANEALSRNSQTKLTLTNLMLSL